MGKASRTGTEGIAVTAIAVAVNFVIQGQLVTAAVSAAIGVISLLVSDHLKLKDISVSEEQIKQISEETSGAIEDVSDDYSGPGSDD